MGTIPSIFLSRDSPINGVCLPERVTIRISNFEAKNEVTRAADLLIFLTDEFGGDLFCGLCVSKHSGQIASKEADHDKNDDDWSCRAIIRIKPLFLFVAKSDRKRI